MKLPKYVSFILMHPKILCIENREQRRASGCKTSLQVQYKITEVHGQQYFLPFMYVFILPFQKNMIILFVSFPSIPHSEFKSSNFELWQNWRIFLRFLERLFFTMKNLATLKKLRSHHASNFDQNFSQLSLSQLRQIFAEIRQQALIFHGETRARNLAQSD